MTLTKIYLLENIPIQLIPKIGQHSSNFRNCLSSDNKNFRNYKGLDNCIWVYPLIFWKKIENDLKKLSSISNTNRAFIRNTARYASPVKFDKQGRINLTNVLVEYASLDKDASIIGMINKIEIWNPSILDKVDKESSKLKMMSTMSLQTKSSFNVKKSDSKSKEFHVPVMIKEVIEYLNIKENGIYVMEPLIGVTQQKSFQILAKENLLV